MITENWNPRSRHCEKNIKRIKKMRPTRALNITYLACKESGAQFEMLYNHSVSTIDFWSEVYFEDKDRDIVSCRNDRCGNFFGLRRIQPLSDPFFFVQNNGIRDRNTQSGYLRQERTPKADCHGGTDV